MPESDLDRRLEERFPSNAAKRITDNSNDEEKKPLQGKVVEKKKGLGERIAEAFIMTDGASIKDYLIFNVLIPGVKNTIENVIHMILYPTKGDTRIVRRGGESRIIPVKYRGRFEERRRNDEYVGSRMRANKPELVFDHREDAEEILGIMTRKIERTGFASMKELYREAELPTDFTYDSWGWRNLYDAMIVQVSEGWLLKMPEMEER